MLETNTIMLSSRVTCIYFPSCSTLFYRQQVFKGPKGFGQLRDTFLPVKKCCDAGIVTAVIEEKEKTLACSIKCPLIESSFGERQCAAVQY